MRLVRIFIDQESLQNGTILNSTDNDFNYLIRVMRKKVSDQFLVFNGKDGEFLAKIVEVNKRNCLAEIECQTKEQYFPHKIILAFSLIKAAHVDFIIQKATELGVTKFKPIITENTIVDKINYERFKANIKEATEQCERLDLPKLEEVSKLDNFLKTINDKQIIIWCDESGGGRQAKQFLEKINYNDAENEIIIIVGPEGGFSKNELQKLTNLKNSYSINLGPRILRSDTACVAALTLIQEFIGDFNLKCRFKI